MGISNGRFSIKICRPSKILPEIRLGRAVCPSFALEYDLVVAILAVQYLTLPNHSTQRPPRYPFHLVTSTRYFPRGSKLTRASANDRGECMVTPLNTLR